MWWTFCETRVLLRDAIGKLAVTDYYQSVEHIGTHSAKKVGCGAHNFLMYLSFECLQLIKYWTVAELLISMKVLFCTDCIFK